MADVKMRPVSLRPGGGAGANPFAKFGKGAASKTAAVKQQVGARQLRPKRCGRCLHARHAGRDALWCANLHLGSYQGVLAILAGIAVLCRGQAQEA